jgi:hypothetical protein
MVKHKPNKCNLLLFVQDSYSFSIFYDKTDLPESVLGLTYLRPLSLSIRSQLSLIVKNVSLSIDIVKGERMRKSTVQCDLNCSPHHQFFFAERVLQTIDILLVDM